MISDPCNECGNVFWVDDKEIPPEMTRQGKDLSVIPKCDGIGDAKHTFQAFALFKVLGTERMGYFDIRNHNE